MVLDKPEICTGTGMAGILRNRRESCGISGKSAGMGTIVVGIPQG